MDWFFTIPGQPVPKARPRLTLEGRFFSPRHTVEAEEYVQWQFASAVGSMRPRKNIYAVACQFFTKNRRRVDLDNLSKLILDSLNGIVWEDDCQVWQLDLARYVDKENPRTEVKIWILQ